jgi:hypothetical protein
MIGLYYIPKLAHATVDRLNVAVIKTIDLVVPSGHNKKHKQYD